MSIPSWISISNYANSISCTRDSCVFSYPCNSSIYCYPYGVIISPSKYIFEVWGAKGGGLNDNGGIGGYSKGVISFGQQVGLFIHIGAKGNYSIGPNINTSYSYNGGGIGCASSNTEYSAGSGGGGTDIRIESNSLYSRVIVAGGGGGEGYYKGILSPGGPAGGINGSNGITNYDSSQFGLGGNQEGPGILYTSGSFGFGGNSSAYNTLGGGGGGWYGGGAGYWRGSSGGGGSGYVFTINSYKPSGFLLDSRYYLTNTSLLNGNQAIDYPNGIEYNGYGLARITIIQEPQCPTYYIALSYNQLIPFVVSMIMIILIF